VEAQQPAGAAGDLGGGGSIETPFGTLYGTNITPDSDTGIGRWNEEDFVRSMRMGRGPDGTRYYPVFPYPAFTLITDDDLGDLWAYLRSLPAVTRANRPHALQFPYSLRATAMLWQWLFFSPGVFEPDASAPDIVNDGRYLATALGHCQECHTPRTALGTLDASMLLAGAADGPEGELAPNITPDDATGIGEWSRADLTWFLRTGFKPDGDDAQGLMSELIEHGYGKMSQQDLDAVVAYLQTVPAIENRVTAAQD
jgi:mono/diheme cytochrome c family protein